jgi:DNA polymerase-3 subunit epsilon
VIVRVWNVQTSTVQIALTDIPSLCVFDLETTGVNTDEDRIVTCFIGRVMRDGQVNGSYSWLVNPGIPIPDGASAIHGVTDEVAQRDGADPATAIAEMLTVLRRSIAGGRPIVAYNASFDLSMLNAEARRYGLEPIEDFGPVLDPYVIDKAIDRYRKGKRTLVVTAEYYGVPLEDAHDAQADAVATGRVAWALLAGPRRPTFTPCTTARSAGRSNRPRAFRRTCGSPRATTSSSSTAPGRSASEPTG